MNSAYTDTMLSPVPWADVEQWREVNQSIDYLIDRRCNNRSTLSSIARSIADLLHRAIPTLDALCAATCPWCPVPCCFHASIWWDLPDLLYLHLAEACLPLTQPRLTSTEPCSCLGPKGCLLPRSLRPWICTWYLCPTQLAHGRKYEPELLSRLMSELKFMQKQRKKLEAAFIKETA